MGPTHWVTVASTVQGYTQVGYVPPSIYHQPQITITVRNSAGAIIAGGSTHYGPMVQPSANVNYSASEAFVIASGDNDAVTENDLVYCSLANSPFSSAAFTDTLRLTVSYWGPPVTIQNNLCYYGSLVCTPPTTATCPNGYGITFVPACPAYVRAEWLVSNVEGCIVSLVNAATGPGPCS